MIHSRLILDILDLALDGQDVPENIRKQIPYLTERNREHTDVGVYIYFDNESKIQSLSSQNQDASKEDKMFNGVEIVNSSRNVLADATVHLQNGLIECVEIWNKNGEDYPQDDLTEYEMYQVWLSVDIRRKINRTSS
jgi:hypothetical protein